jgi:hypothetical protein
MKWRISMAKILRSREQESARPTRMDLMVGRVLQARHDGFVSGILKMRDSGEISPSDHRVKMAEVQAKRGRDVARPLSDKGFISQFDAEMKKQMKKELPLHVRGRLAAIKKSADVMGALHKSGKLKNGAVAEGISGLSEKALNAIHRDKKAKSKDGSGFFGLAAKGSDEISRESLRKSFGKRGLVSDVAAEKGMRWTSAASNLCALGMIGKADPRLKVKEKDVAGKVSKTKSDFDSDEVNSGTAATSVLQLGRSLDDATQTLGNRLNSAGKELREERLASPVDKARNRFDRAALSEATGLASLKAGGYQGNAQNLFANAAANTSKGIETILPRKKTRVSGLEK